MRLQAGEQYRHYKSSGWNDYTYEVVGIGLHTETGESFVVYKPLYDIAITQNFFVRPLSMRDELVEWKGVMVKRFERI